MSTLSEEEMETRLRAFYATHNPGNEQNIGEIARKYRGKEAALCARLAKKYGVAPDLGLEKPPPSSAPAPVGGRLVKSLVVDVYDAEYEVRRAEKPTGDGALDFRSSAFDALRALRARHLAPPVEGLTPLDNIFKCRHLLPVSDPNYQKLVIVTAKKSTPAKDPHSANASTGAAAIVPPAQRVPALFEVLADTYLDGPFTVLRRCFLERKRVRVVIRRVSSVRGTCSGFLKAFDKHMNMVLIDVEEVLVPYNAYEKRDREHARRKREGLTSAGETAVFSVADSKRNQRVATTRYVKQMFVRGDNVVMAMEAPSQLPPLQMKSKTTRAERNYHPRR